MSLKPKQAGTDPADARGCGSPDLESGGMIQKQDHKADAAKQSDLTQYSQLESSARHIITALHQTKQELAAEMEANLKQLKAVLKETERIAKDMEAVLKEAKAEPTPEQMARGVRRPEWNPPGYEGEKPGAWLAQKEAGDKESKEKAPEWEPPSDPDPAQQQAH